MKRSASQFPSQFVADRRSSDCDATKPLQCIGNWRSVAVSASQSSQFPETRGIAGRRSSAAARVSPPIPPKRLRALLGSGRSASGALLRAAGSSVDDAAADDGVPVRAYHALGTILSPRFFVLVAFLSLWYREYAWPILPTSALISAHSACRVPRQLWGVSVRELASPVMMARRRPAQEQGCMNVAIARKAQFPPGKIRPESRNGHDPG
jgi:hypothetical protein